MNNELVDEAAEKGRAAFMKAQALTGAAERAFAAVLRMKEGSKGTSRRCGRPSPAIRN